LANAPARANEGERVKTILCYGDSNTWGTDPARGPRFAPDVRWTGVLQRELGDGYRVIEEGLGGRTTVHDDPIESHRNGRTYLVPCLESHQPLDLVAIMLGTNDLKRRFDLSASDIAQGAASLGQLARRTARTATGEPPLVLLIAPPPIARLGEYDQMFEGAAEKSRRFADYYRFAAGWHDLAFFDAGSVIASSDVDGIHFDPPEHRKLGQALAAEISRLLG
jgi:lysophospholipase L1-like esterase